MAGLSTAFTARCVAAKLGVDQQLIENIAAMKMEPEDGVISIYDSDDPDAYCVTAFTRSGIENLEQLLADGKIR